jgi:hypothetical protein
VQKHLNHLSKTKKWLEANSESVEDYQIFRLNNAYKTLIGHNDEVKRWKLIRQARIRKELITERLEKHILELEGKGR